MSGYKGVECQSLECDEYEITSERIMNNLFFIMENSDLLERCLDAAKVRGI